MRDEAAAEGCAYRSGDLGNPPHHGSRGHPWSAWVVGRKIKWTWVTDARCLSAFSTYGPHFSGYSRFDTPSGGWADPVKPSALVPCGWLKAPSL